MTLLPRQCRAARGLLGWSQGTLSLKAGVARKTIADFEQGLTTPYPRTLRDIRRTLEAHGVILLEEEKGVFGPGVRLRYDLDKVGEPPSTSED